MIIITYRQYYHLHIITNIPWAFQTSSLETIQMFCFARNYNKTLFSHKTNLRHEENNGTEPNMLVVTYLLDVKPSGTHYYKQKHENYD